MKKYYVLFYCILFCFKIHAQEYKRNNLWTLGFAPVITLDFNNNANLTIDSLAFPALRFNSSIADTNGSLTFFTTGFILYSRDGSNLKNGDTTNCPLGKKLYNYYYGGSLYDQTSIILPKVGNQYYVINTGMSDSAWDERQTNFRFDVLSYCVVDMDGNAGKGKVIIKDSVLMQNARLSHNKMTATRHANGRDWWLIKPHQTEHKFYKFLVTPYGIALQDSQSFALPNLPIIILSQSTFNESGIQYAFCSNTETRNTVSLYNFNRCNGMLAFNHTIETPHDTSSYFEDDYSSGVCFSSNDSLLYIVNEFTIWQKYIYDTSAPILITGPDTNIVYFPVYRNAKLAPNGKIYIGNASGQLKSMAFIDSPNVRGLGCAFRGRGNGALTQSYTNILTPPNMPNFALGKLVGSGCDTLFATGLQNVITTKQPSVFIYPNPATNTININYKLSLTEKATLNIYNLLGMLIKQVLINSNKELLNINVSGIQSGLYTYKFIPTLNNSTSGKLIIK
jgi:hypothetical protein